jgi:uncharacterized membrane protein (UPF0127 family)
MPRWVSVRNRSHDGQMLVRARWCESYLCRLRGLMFRRNLGECEGLLLVDEGESISGSAIHMWAVFMSLGVVWINNEMRVVDTRVARPWRIYFPAGPAHYVLEGPPEMLDGVKVGDVLEFEDES